MAAGSPPWTAPSSGDGRVVLHEGKVDTLGRIVGYRKRDREQPGVRQTEPLELPCEPTVIAGVPGNHYPALRGGEGKLGVLAGAIPAALMGASSLDAVGARHLRCQRREVLIQVVARTCQGTSGPHEHRLRAQVLRQVGVVVLDAGQDVGGLASGLHHRGCRRCLTQLTPKLVYILFQDQHPPLESGEVLPKVPVFVVEQVTAAAGHDSWASKSRSCMASLCYRRTDSSPPFEHLCGRGAGGVRRCRDTVRRTALPCGSVKRWPSAGAPA